MIDGRLEDLLAVAHQVASRVPTRIVSISFQAGSIRSPEMAFGLVIGTAAGSSARAGALDTSQSRRPRDPGSLPGIVGVSSHPGIGGSSSEAPKRPRSWIRKLSTIFLRRRVRTQARSVGQSPFAHSLPPTASLGLETILAT